MVGERENVPRGKRDADNANNANNVNNVTNDNDNVSCTYSRRKNEKKTKFETAGADDIEINEAYEHQQLVDKFVQEVIEKAKKEYFRQTGGAKSKGGKRKKGKENGELLSDNSSKKSDKNKDKKKHHYKYSEPVDEKDISEYEQGDGDAAVQWNPSFGKERKDSQRTSNSFYNRTIASLRNLLGCCIGKT